MPAPIVPAPITAACSSGRTGVSAARSATFPAARSARNACRSAFDSGLCMSSTKASRSTVRPLSNGSAAAATASTARSVAGRGCRSDDSLTRAASHAAASAAGSTARSRVRRGGGDSDFGKGDRLFNRVSGNHPVQQTALPQRRRPVPARRRECSSSARAGATSRGRRWVPPAPGISPSFTSGSPSVASRAAIR